MANMQCSGQIRIRKFFGLPDPDPSVRGTDPNPDPSIIKQKSLRNPLILLFCDLFI